MAEFSDYFDDDDDIVATAAYILDTARQGLEEGQLTREQFDELVEDTLQIEEIDELADDLERKNYVTKAFNLFKEMTGFIPI